MKNSNTYLVLIYYFIFVFIKRTIDFTAEYFYPVNQDLEYTKKNLGIFKGRNIDILREVLTFISMLLSLYIVLSFKLNTYILSILSILIISNIFYLLVDEGYIYLMFNDKKSIDTILYIDKINDNRFINVMLVSYFAYVLYRIYL